MQKSLTWPADSCERFGHLIDATDRNQQDVKLIMPHRRFVRDVELVVTYHKPGVSATPGGASAPAGKGRGGFPAMRRCILLNDLLILAVPTALAKAKKGREAATAWTVEHVIKLQDALVSVPDDDEARTAPGLEPGSPAVHVFILETVMMATEDPAAARATGAGGGRMSISRRHSMNISHWHLALPTADARDEWQSTVYDLAEEAREQTEQITRRRSIASSPASSVGGSSPAGSQRGPSVASIAEGKASSMDGGEYGWASPPGSALISERSQREHSFGAAGGGGRGGSPAMGGGGERVRGLSASGAALSNCPSCSQVLTVPKHTVCFACCQCKAILFQPLDRSTRDGRPSAFLERVLERGSLVKAPLSKGGGRRMSLINRDKTRWVASGTRCNQYFAE